VVAPPSFAVRLVFADVDDQRLAQAVLGDALLHLGRVVAQLVAGELLQPRDRHHLPDARHHLPDALVGVHLAGGVSRDRRVVYTERLAPTIAYPPPDFFDTRHRGSADNLFISSPCVVALLAGCSVFFGGTDELCVPGFGVVYDIVSLRSFRDSALGRAVEVNDDDIRAALMWYDCVESNTVSDEVFMQLLDVALGHPHAVEGRRAIGTLALALDAANSLRNVYPLLDVGGDEL
jgi:hypothetical protein